jgi:hypothetical protein
MLQIIKIRSRQGQAKSSGMGKRNYGPSPEAGRKDVAHHVICYGECRSTRYRLPLGVDLA